MDKEELDIGYDTGSIKFTVAGVEKESKDHKVIYNITKGMMGCVASDEYRLVQHKELYEYVESYLNNLNIPYTVNLRQQRNKAYMDFKFQNAKIVLKEKGEEFIGGLRLINSYDKSTGVFVIPFMTRMVCSNGMVVSILSKNRNSIWHNSKQIDKLGEVISLKMTELINMDQKLQEYVSECIADSVEWGIVDKLLKHFVKIDKHIEEIKKRITTNNPTRWDIYNAMTHYATHGLQLKPATEMWIQNKAMELMEKPIAKMIEVYNEK